MKIFGKVAVGIVRASRKFFRAPIYGAHCEVIFAQLSCYLCFYIYPLHYTVKLIIEAPSVTPWPLLKTRLVLETRLTFYGYIMRCQSGLRPRLAYVAPQIAVYEGAASQQGTGWEQKE